MFIALEFRIKLLEIVAVVVVSSPHQSPRCGVSPFRSEQSMTIVEPKYVNCMTTSRLQSPIEMLDTLLASCVTTNIL